MTKQLLFQLYDRNAESIAGPIMLERKEGPAIRLFHSLLADKNTTPGQHPDDFELMLVGEQDMDTGVVTGCTPRIIATGTAWNQQHTQGTPASALQQAATLRGSDISLHPEHVR